MAQPLVRPTRNRPRALRAAALVALGLVLIQRAPAATLTAPAPGSAPVADDCACKMGCKPGKCCCKREKPARAKPQAPSHHTATPPAGPCVDAAPCGGEGLPTVAPVAPLTKNAVLAPLARQPRLPAGPKAAPADERRPLEPLALPPVDPPELDRIG